MPEKAETGADVKGAGSCVVLKQARRSAGPPVTVPLLLTLVRYDMGVSGQTVGAGPRYFDDRRNNSNRNNDLGGGEFNTFAVS